MRNLDFNGSIKLGSSYPTKDTSTKFIVTGWVCLCCKEQPKCRTKLSVSSVIRVPNLYKMPLLLMKHWKHYNHNIHKHTAANLNTFSSATLFAIWNGVNT